MGIVAVVLLPCLALRCARGNNSQYSAKADFLYPSTKVKDYNSIWLNVLFVTNYKKVSGLN